MWNYLVIQIEGVGWMQPFDQETHWAYKTAQITRIGWFVFHIFVVALLLGNNPFFWLLMALLFAAFLIPQWSEHRSAAQYPLLEFLLSGLFLIVGCTILGKYSSFLSFPALCAGLYSRPGKERWVLWGGFSAVPLLAYVGIGLNQIGMGVIDGLFFFGIGIAIAKVIEAEKKMQQLLEENRRQNQLLEQYAKQVEKVTLLEERNRLARELHDTIGHTYTSVIMGLDAAAFLIEASPEKAKDQVERLGTVMRKSLEEVRDHLHQMSPSGEEKEEFAEKLRGVADEFALHTKIEIKFESSGGNVTPSIQGSIALVRCLQEALTNAVRHGKASEIFIRLQQKPSQVLLTIQDNGRGMDVIRYGFGLSGMKERLESLQGELTLESKVEQGTIVTCILPIKRGEVLLDDQSVDCG
jgi:signal transduction histidine kinase